VAALVVLLATPIAYLCRLTCRSRSLDLAPRGGLQLLAVRRVPGIRVNPYIYEVGDAAVFLEPPAAKPIHQSARNYNYSYGSEAGISCLKALSCDARKLRGEKLANREPINDQ